MSSATIITSSWFKRDMFVSASDAGSRLRCGSEVSCGVFAVFGRVSVSGACFSAFSVGVSHPRTNQSLIAGSILASAASPTRIDTGCWAAFGWVITVFACVVVVLHRRWSDVQRQIHGGVWILAHKVGISGSSCWTLFVRRSWLGLAVVSLAVTNYVASSSSTLRR